MSARRRRQHQVKVRDEQFRKWWIREFRSTMQILRNTGRGPFAPGPWWPEDHPKYRPEAPRGA